MWKNLTKNVKKNENLKLNRKKEIIQNENQIPNKKSNIENLLHFRYL